MTHFFTLRVRAFLCVRVCVSVWTSVFARLVVILLAYAA